ncbi:MAG: L-threonylcarbamoyladenylate synthase [Kiritimatiellia bacterium]
MKPHAILLIGPTGSGKTPLGNIAETQGLHNRPCAHFDFGAQLRAHQHAPPETMTPESLTIIHTVLEQGRLLEPDEDFVACEILLNWLHNRSTETIVILNGLPRTIAQARAIASILHVSMVIELVADDSIIMQRISTNSGGDRKGREDDEYDAIKKRLDTYRRKTRPLVKHYMRNHIPVLQVLVSIQTDPRDVWSKVPPLLQNQTDAPVYITPREAAAILKQGGVVAVPTETVYGLAADAFNLPAIERIFAIKKRPGNDPLIVHIHDLSQITPLITQWPEAAQKLARQFWPGPLTMVLPKSAAVPDIVTAQLPTVAIRMPAHPVIRSILEHCQCPLAAPSANQFGNISPTTAQHVAHSLGNEPDGIVDGGPCEVGLESTIVAFGAEAIYILRPGVITAAQIATATGLPVKPYQPAHQQDIPAPGTMPRHYAPQTPVAIIGTPDANALQQGRIGHLRFGPRQLAHTRHDTEINLSESGDLQEAAKRLYDALRYLDQLNLDAILVEPIPNEGIGTAINDRLHRACHRT